MAVTAAEGDRKKLTQLIDHTGNLPPSAQEKLLSLLGSEATARLPESDRLSLWAELVDLVTKHRKFSDTEWAMQPEQVDKIAAVTNRLAPHAPEIRHQRLFSERDFDLYEEKDNYEDQRNELELRRQKAVGEIAAKGGSKAILTFAVAVQSPWRVGIAAGVVASPEVDRVVLPGLLKSEQQQLAQFTGGFVWSRFRIGGWLWVDAIDTTLWTSLQIGQFLSFLPFVTETWERATRLLGPNEVAYWSNTSASPYEAETGLDLAADRLIQYGRPHAALRCINRILRDKQPFDGGQAVRALLAALESAEGTHAVDAYQTVEIIKALQADTATSPEDLLRIEWAYLRLLAPPHTEVTPTVLWQRLATEPEFFCEVIRLVFRSKKEECPSDEPTEERKRIAGNAYRLIPWVASPAGLSGGWQLRRRCAWALVGCCKAKM